MVNVSSPWSEEEASISINALQPTQCAAADPAAFRRLGRLSWCVSGHIQDIDRRVEWADYFLEETTMLVTLAEIEQQARMLSAHERAQLAEILLESLHEAPLSEIDAAWRHEIEERVAAYDRGEIQTYAAEEVFAEARRMSR